MGEQQRHNGGAAHPQGGRSSWRCDSARRPAQGLVTPAVERLLLVAPLIGAVVGHAALRGLRLAVRLSAPDGTAQIGAADIPRIAEERNPTDRARRVTPGQFRTLPEHRLDRSIVSPHQVVNRGLAVPIRGATVLRPDFQREKASASLTLLKSCLCMSSSLADLPIVRERKDEDFLCLPVQFNGHTTHSLKRKTHHRPPHTVRTWSTFRQQPRVTSK